MEVNIDIHNKYKRDSYSLVKYWYFINVNKNYISPVVFSLPNIIKFRMKKLLMKTVNNTLKNNKYINKYIKNLK